jgi:hypothetical protein
MPRDGRRDRVEKVADYAALGVLYLDAVWNEIERFEVDRETSPYLDLESTDGDTYAMFTPGRSGIPPAAGRPLPPNLSSR